MSDLSDAHLAADEALRLKAENERLRGLIRAVAPVNWDDCPWCRRQIGEGDDHRDECPWSAIVAEAERP